MERGILFLLCVSGILVTLNPVSANTTSSDDTDTVQPTTTTSTPLVLTTVQSTISPSTTPSTTESITTITTTTPTTTTTTAPTTTTSPPLDIGTNCSDSSNSTRKCGSNADCNNGTCACRDGFFRISETACESADILNVSELHTESSSEFSITVAWSGPTLTSTINYVISYYIEILSGENQTTTDNYTKFDNLTSGTQYNISVHSVLNNTIYSNEAATITEWTTPQSPDCPDYCANYSSPNITINWTKPTNGGVTGYIVTFNGKSQNVTDETIDIGDTTPGRNYSLELGSYLLLPNGTQLNSTERTCRIRTESEIPDQPKNVTFNGTTSTSITLNIVPTDNPRGVIVGYSFDLYYRYYDDEFFGFEENRTLTDTLNNEYTLSSLKAGAHYYILVFTVNDGFRSDGFTNLTNITLNEGVPDKIVHKTFTSREKSIDVRWQRPAVPRGNIIGYRLQINGLINKQSMSCEEYILATSAGNISHNGTCSREGNSTISQNQVDMNQTIDGLSPYQDYNVTVWAYTSVGQGSEHKFGVQTITAVPKKPSNVMGSHTSKSSVSVSWTQPSQKTGRTNYKVHTYDIVDKTNASDKSCNTSGFDQTSCTVTNLRPFWKYRFKVTATTTAGSNVSDDAAEVITLPAKPGEVASFTFSLQEKGCRVTLTWSTPDLKNRRSKVTEYLIYTDSSYQKYLDPDPKPYERDNKKFTEVITLAQKDSGVVVVKISASGENVGESDLPVERRIITSECYEPLSAGEIVGIVFSVLMAIALVTFLLFIAYRRRESIIDFCQTRRGSRGEFEPLQPPVERYRPIVVNDIGQFLQKYHADDHRLFISEYDDLKYLSASHQTNAANLDENKPKNRYTNILPYDHSRVILAPTDDEESSDYINANYIPGYTYGKEFIASQGPLPGTANDFWRMIWEQSVSIIVMLTKCKENNMDKCEHYWPDNVNEPKCYDDLMVNVTSISNMDKYDIHVMDLCFGDEKRVVKHFHFLEWPDFSAKVETSTLIEFISTVRSHITPDIKGPTVTHCSAGVGRTGTFITVDYLMQFVRDHDFASQVDIFDWVLNMREHRTMMVQTMTQYAFIHDCLADLVERKKRSLQIVNGEVAIDNPAFEPDDLYENTKLGPLDVESDPDPDPDPKTEL